ncbi:MAG: type II secretion system protein [Minisyncoccia bacterium]
MNYSKKQDKGFTLVELMTVIAIIGLLSTVVLSSVNSAKIKANNAKIKMNAKQIANAIYLARDPVTGAWPGNGTWQCLKASGTCWKGDLSADTSANNVVSKISVYMPNIPLIPNNLFPSTTYAYDSYVYIPNWSGFPPKIGAYLLWAQTLPITSKECNGTIDSSIETGNYYCYEFLGS